MSCVCVCVCVFGIIVLNIFVERWFWELKMLTGSFDELHVWLHSYLRFSLLEKRFLSYLDTSSIPPRHPAICRALRLCSYRNLDRSSTTRWIDQESSWTLNSFSIASGSIKLLFLCLCFVPWHLLISFICWHCFSQHLPWQMAWHLYLSRFTEPLYIGFMRSGISFHSISLSIASCSLFPNLSHSLQTSSSRFFKPLLVFLHLVNFESLIFMHFHVLKPRFWGFWKILGFFKIDELLLKFLGWVLKI